MLPGTQPSLGRDPVPLSSALGPGLRALVRERNGGGLQEVAAPQARSDALALVKLSLIVADVFVIALVLLWRQSSSDVMGAAEAMMCVAAMTFGAWLTGLAAWLHFGRR